MSHNNVLFADIIIVLAIIIPFIVIIFPLFLSLYATVDKNGKTLKITIALFGITVFNLSAKLLGTNIIVKQSFKKEHKISCLNLIKKRGGINKLKGVSVLKLSYIIETGFNDEFFLPFMTTLALDSVKNISFSALKHYKPYIDLKGNFNLIYGTNNIRIYLSIGTVLNLMTVLIIIIKILSEKLKNAIGKQ